MAGTDPLTATAITLGATAVWSFDEASGPLLDRVGSNDGTIVGTPEYQVDDQRGLPGAYTLDGSTDHIELAADPTNLSAYTIEAVFKTSSATTQVIYDERDSSGNGVVLFTSSAQDVRCNHYATTLEGGDVSDGDWHHVHATWNGSELHICLDGVVVDSDTVATAVTSSSLPHIGSRSYAGVTQRFNGQISHVAIYPTKLDTDQISQLIAASTFVNDEFLAVQPAVTPAVASAVQRL